MPGDKSSRLRFLGGGVVSFGGGVSFVVLFGVDGGSLVTAVAVGEVVVGEAGVGIVGVAGTGALPVVSVISGEAVVGDTAGKAVGDAVPPV